MISSLGVLHYFVPSSHQSSYGFQHNQHGFISGENTTNAISSLTQKILKEWENKNKVAGQKAFDCIEWDILMEKINTPMTWIEQ